MRRLATNSSLLVEDIRRIKQSSFPLIQPSFVKLTQLAQFDKISNACQWHETSDCLRHTWYRKLSGLSGRASDL